MLLVLLLSLLSLAAAQDQATNSWFLFILFFLFVLLIAGCFIWYTPGSYLYPRVAHVYRSRSDPESQGRGVPARSVVLGRHM